MAYESFHVDFDFSFKFLDEKIGQNFKIVVISTRWRNLTDFIEFEIYYSEIQNDGLKSSSL